MTITTYTDREIALQAQLAAMTASRDEYQLAAVMMVWDHKVERDKLRQHIKHIGNDALRSENHELRQQLAKAQRDVERYLWLRDNSASISWNPSRYNAEIVSGFAYAGTGYLGFSFEDAIKEAMKGAK
jgi:threonine synthase